MTALAGEVLSILVWRTVSNRGNNTVRDSAWREKGRKQDASAVPTSAEFRCPVCQRICSSRIGLHSHVRTHVK